MKKSQLFAAMLLLILAISCQKEQLVVEPETPETASTSQDAIEEESQSATTRAKKEKVTLCHHTSSATNPWVIITISKNAVPYPAHLSHGDVILVDADGDGWVEAENHCVPGGDCDDNDPNVYPGAPEVRCNGIDDDCNPDTPDEQEEICDNGIDDDCDGLVDAEDSDCGATEGCSTGVAIDYEGQLFVHPVDITGTHTWQSANSACENLVSSPDGCEEWRLPTKDELNELYLNKDLIGGFSGRRAVYWSSTDFGDIGAWQQSFANGSQNTSIKFSEALCRCVRK